MKNLLREEVPIRDRAKDGIAIEPIEAQRTMSAVQSCVETFTKRSLLPVFLTGGAIPRHLRQSISHYMPQIAVLSHGEIADGVKIQFHGIIRCSDES